MGVATHAAMEWWVVLALVCVLVVQALAKDLDSESTLSKGDNLCKVDEDCDEDNFEMCCFDLSSPGNWTNDQKTWRKTCCTNPSGSPIIEPPANLTQPQMASKLQQTSGAPSTMGSFILISSWPACHILWQ